MPGWLERHQVLIIGLISLVIAAGLAVSRLDARSSPEPIVFREGPSVAAGTPIRVHVAGAVLAPGVYDLRAGDRVAEVLAAAGGPLDEADLDQINLARRVRDEEQLLVPGRTVARARVVESLPAGSKLDVNLASTAQLDQLPGIGEAYARRIVDSRKVDGPYKSTQDLVDRRVLPKAIYDRIRDLISASPP